VEQVLEEKLAMILREPIDLVGCGRTDAGVSAKNYVAHFDSHCQDLISNKAHWIYKFNTLLPPSIAVQNIQKVKDEIHARFYATERVYYYYLNQHKDPFKDAFSWYVYGELDFERMNLAAATLLEYTDFTSFSKVNTQTKTNNCKIQKAVWQKSGTSEWRFTIQADRFLRGMVRAIVGTLVMVGKHKISVEEFKKIIEGKDRQLAGNNAPPKGLFLVGINYPKDVYAD
jgi:tRNA pseudouridine38-40 synthase